MKGLNRRSLDELIRSATAQALNETLGSLVKDERRAQQDMANRINGTGATTTLGETDLEEAEDEEADKSDQGKVAAVKPAGAKGEKSGEPEKKNVVSKKIATGKEEPKPEAIIPDPTEIKDVTFDQMINMMNMMRSGKSTKNPDTKQSLKDYFKGLNVGERQAMFVLLSGLTQILAGGVEGKDAPDPSQVGIEINPRKDVGKGPGSQRSPAQTSPASQIKRPGQVPDKDLPIVVGEAADKASKLQILARIRRGV
jgi:hypothetical protein